MYGNQTIIKKLRAAIIHVYELLFKILKKKNLSKCHVRACEIASRAE